jgi:hypothetical protein
MPLRPRIRSHLLNPAAAPGVGCVVSGRPGGKMASGASKGVHINLDLAKTLFDWALRIIPIIGFAFSFYINQDRAVDKSHSNDQRITSLDTKINELERELVQERIEKSALQQRVEDQEKFYLLTHNR